MFMKVEDGATQHPIDPTVVLQRQIDSIISSVRRIAGGLRPPNAGRSRAGGGACLVGR
jgi:hypothetical protein